MRFLLMVASLSGCAWVAMDHLPSDYRSSEVPHCAEQSATYVLDFVSAATDVLLISLIVSHPAPPGQSNAGPIIGTVVDGLLSLASAGTGVRWAHECRDAKAAFDGDDSYDADKASARKQRARREIEQLKTEHPELLDAGIDAAPDDDKTAAAKWRSLCRAHPEECADDAGIDGGE